MSQRYVSIAAAVVAALVVTIGPVRAQTSPNTGVSPSPGNENTHTDANDNGAVDDASPSASPHGEKDGTSSKGDRDQQREMNEIDRNSDLDLAGVRK